MWDQSMGILSCLATRLTTQLSSVIVVKPIVSVLVRHLLTYSCLLDVFKQL